MRQIKYQILTPSGFQKFDGVSRKQSKIIIKIELENQKFLECTENHQILLSSTNKFIDSNKLFIDDFIETKFGSKKIINITRQKCNDFVYDVINVENGNQYYTNDFISHNCQFLGSSDTLLSGNCLEKMVFKEPEKSDEHSKFFELPKENHIYVMTVDVGEGVGRDFSTISVIDVSVKPYEQVYVYKRNDISPWIFSSTVYEIGMKYNQAYALIENNSIGKIVADSMFNEYEYENILSSKLMKNNDEKISNYSIISSGIQMNKKTKMIGCSALKTLLEDSMLLINDWETIQELSSFVKIGTSYKAEKNKFDDLVMPLVSFGWLTTQTTFEDLTSSNLNNLLKEKREKEAENTHCIFGFVSDGIENN